MVNMTGEKGRRNCPVIFWSQTKTDININIDLLLDDIVSKIIAYHGIYSNLKNDRLI